MTSPSTSERITITHYSACNGSYQVDQTLIPPFVSHKEFRQGAITELEWREFVHLVDSHLQPINKLRHALKLVLAITALILLAFIIFIFFGYDQPTHEYFVDHLDFWLMPVFAGMLASTGIALSVYTAMSTKRALLTIQRLCEEQSKVLSTTTRSKHQSLLVSFHLCDERSTKAFDVPTHDLVYTGKDYYHHPFRTYHNVYILAVVSMVDPENPFADSGQFRLPVKFPTIEFDAPTDDDNSTLGESTIYTSMTGGMTVTQDILKSIENERKQQQARIAHSDGNVETDRGVAPVADVAAKKNAKKPKKKKTSTKNSSKSSSRQGKKEATPGKEKKLKRTKSNQSRLETISEST
jgi:hypothetical protein